MTVATQAVSAANFAGETLAEEKWPGESPTIVAHFNTTHLNFNSILIDSFFMQTIPNWRSSANSQEMRSKLARMGPEGQTVQARTRCLQQRGRSLKNLRTKSLRRKNQRKNWPSRLCRRRAAKCWRNRCQLTCCTTITDGLFYGRSILVSAHSYSSLRLQRQCCAFKPNVVYLFKLIWSFYRP